LQAPLLALPPALAAYELALSDGGNNLSYTYDAQAGPSRIDELLRGLAEAGINFKDLHTTQSSLEDIFVSLVHDESKTESTSP
jgi:ABC-2 type transport system ATP-binding protein